ncbi:uncharacterized protein BO96DRAFT_328166 [Aspergillus niger CBS 101883]|uniref:Uncharacterized protein n=2 Tax=Aspergillus niger TaxID=5061 RepID=A2QPJ2_ASPNC|nr:uncharacterized protein BO96DRAFT_328166 [Aspergillus niger CBS 101883]XP_059601099.1 hypothetical protein An07g09640 [Aspergillus niger]PYH60689.1 hypothetical protein BO96DRAFT_328166 [Aspergillus niger CBS 101883]CAK39729.1 hypothetical protein An07g09640 [Aspergillus niger]
MAQARDYYYLESLWEDDVFVPGSIGPLCSTHLTHRWARSVAPSGLGVIEKDSAGCIAYPVCNPVHPDGKLVFGLILPLSHLDQDGAANTCQIEYLY